jgi:hypothetical protein
MIRVNDIQLEVDDETLINGIGSLPGNLVKDSVSLESKNPFLMALIFIYTAKLYRMYAIFLLSLFFYLNFVRFALKQKNQKFKTWKLRLKITYPL